VRQALAFLILVLLSVPAAAQSGSNPGGAVSTPPLLFRDEGSNVGRATRAVDCTGTGVTCSASAGVVTINVGAGGSANTVEVSLAMTGGSGFYSTTVTGQAWVTGTSKIVCGPFGTTDDGLTPEQVAVAALDVTIANRVVGTGFDLMVFNPFGSTGTHRFHCTGA